MVRKLKAKCISCFWRLKCKKIIANAIRSWTTKNRRNSVFRSKEKTNKVPPNIFRDSEVRKKLRFMFWRPNDSMKGKCYVFSGYKQRNKLCLVYLECKLQQDSYGWCIFKLKCKKTVEKTYIETSKTKQDTVDVFKC